MAGKVYLFLPEGSDGSPIAAQIPVTETKNYGDKKGTVREAISAASEGETSIIAAKTEQFMDFKLLLLKGLSVRILRSSKISAQVGSSLPENSKEYYLHTAIPEGGEAFASADGLYSPISCKVGKGKVILVPLDEDRLAQAIEAGAISPEEPAKTSKERLAESLSKVIASGKKIAVADFGKSAALMAVVNSLGAEQETFVTVTALTDVKYGAKDFEASLAKSAKETAECDFGVVVSELSEEGVTICVSDSETARVEKISAEEGEDAKHLLAAAVVRLCEMVCDATEEGAISAPAIGIPGISQKAFVILISCLGAAFIACLIICIVLFAKTPESVSTDNSTDAYSNTEEDIVNMGEVSPFLDSDITATEANTDSALVDSFDNYTTYPGRSSNGEGAQAVFTTMATTYEDEINLAAEEVVTDENGNIIETTTSAPKGKFVFTVYGWGHGAGMSQDGAKALARSGYTCNEILTYYYPNTTIMTDRNTPMYIEQPDENGEGGYTLLAFLCRTVKQEIGDGAPYEALKAQAVAAYTYAMYHNNFGAGQTMDADYAYEGTTVESAVMEVLNITSADQQPHANYISYNGKYANAVYYANCAGTTTSSVNAWGGSSISYLCGGVSSPEEVSITTYEISAKDMKKKIQSYANSNGLSVDFSGSPATWLDIISHDGSYSDAVGYIGEIAICGNTVSGNTFRTSVMGGKLRSHCFTIQYVTE